MPERVVPAPDDSERAQPALDPFVEVRELPVDRLRALEMKDRPDGVAGDAALELVDRTHDVKLALGDRKELRGDPHRAGNGQPFLLRDDVTVGGPHDGRARIGGLVVPCGNEHRKEACDDAALAHARHVEVPAVALEERASAAPDSQQRIVVAVDDGDHSSSPGRSEYSAQSCRRPMRAFQCALRSTPSSV